VESAEQEWRAPENESGEAFDAVEVREDARLLAAMAAGEPHALEAFYRRRGALVYSLVSRMLLNEMEAQEVTQDTFVQIWRRAHTYDPRRSSPMVWIVLIARGLALNRLRARSRRSATHAAFEQEVASLEVEEVNSARQVERDELAEVCASALHQLPEEQARAVQLAFLRGWTHEEIATATGEPLGTIKARIRRGLLSLRRALRDYHA
jgi:RNA polymerase sigma-70 factor, ECF subfamily